MKYAIFNTRHDRYASDQAPDGSMGFRANSVNDANALLYDNIKSAVAAVACRYKWVGQQRVFSLPVNELTIVGVREVQDPRYETVDL